LSGFRCVYQALAHYLATKLVLDCGVVAIQSSIVKLTAAILILMLAPIAVSQTNQSGADCKSLVMQSESAAREEMQPQKDEKSHRPPMVAYEVQEDGDVRKLRLVRHSGIKELDGQLLSAASQWKYQARPGCGIVRVRLAAGLIPNEGTALRVAEPELIRIYGASVIASERPLTAGISGNMWIVGGTLHCSDGNGGTTTVCVGGVATAHLSRSDGRVLEIFHTN
jgi:NTF2 fold immunity protein of polymorphic toxin system component